MKPGLIRIYDILYKEFGPQNWWPAETPFEVIVGAILTQNTSWKNVSRAIGNLKNRDLLTPEGMRGLSHSDLEELVRPSGYFRQKAGRLRNFISFLFQYHEGELSSLFSLEKDEMRRQLLNVNGIGPETADSIILYAANKPTFVIDKYTIRIFSEIGLLEENSTYEAAKSFFEYRLLEDVKLFNEYHALIVRLGYSICRKRNPICSICPLNEICASAKNN